MILRDVRIVTNKYALTVYKIVRRLICIKNYVTTYVKAVNIKVKTNNANYAMINDL